MQACSFSFKSNSQMQKMFTPLSFISADVLRLWWFRCWIMKGTQMTLHVLGWEVNSEHGTEEGCPSRLVSCVLLTGASLEINPSEVTEPRRFSPLLATQTAGWNAINHRTIRVNRPTCVCLHKMHPSAQKNTDEKMLLLLLLHQQLLHNCKGWRNAFSVSKGFQNTLPFVWVTSLWWGFSYRVTSSWNDSFCSFSEMWFTVC